MKFIRVYDDATGTEERVPLGGSLPGIPGLNLGGLPPAALSAFAVRAQQRQFQWGHAVQTTGAGTFPTGPIGAPPGATIGLWETVEASSPQYSWTFAPASAAGTLVAMDSWFVCQESGLYHLGAYQNVVLSDPLADLALIRRVELGFEYIKHSDTVSPYGLYPTPNALLDTAHAQRHTTGGPPGGPFYNSYLRAWCLNNSRPRPLWAGDRVRFWWRHYGAGAFQNFDEYSSYSWAFKVADIQGAPPICCEG